MDSAIIRSSARTGPSKVDEPHQVLRELEGLLGVPFTRGNCIRRYVNGVEYFPAMLQAIRESTEAIEFLSYVYWKGDIADQFAEALAQRAAAGVRVRVLLDGHGARPMRRDLVERMRSAGAQVEFVRPLTWRLWRNFRRTHRKVLICDGRIGFTGGVGIASEWEGDARNPGEWRDTHFSVSGPALDGLRAAFVGNWLEDGRTWSKGDERVPEPNGLHEAGSWVQVLKSSSSHGWSDIATLLRIVVSQAERRLVICQGYFVPDVRMNRLICEASRRGVDVTILMAGQHTDARVSREAGDDRVRELLEAGVRCYRYEPTMFHVKVVLVDDDLAIVGSANFNQRSMRWDDEICLVALDRDLVAQLDADAFDDLARSRELRLEEWKRRPWWKRVWEFLGWLVRRHV